MIEEWGGQFFNGCWMQKERSFQHHLCLSFEVSLTSLQSLSVSFSVSKAVTVTMRQDGNDNLLWKRRKKAGGHADDNVRLREHVRPSALQHLGLTHYLAWFHRRGVNLKAWEQTASHFGERKSHGGVGVGLFAVLPRGKQLIYVQAQAETHETCVWTLDAIADKQGAMSCQHLWVGDKFRITWLETLKRRVLLCRCGHNTLHGSECCRAFIDMPNTTVLSQDISVF